jgi:hypothetical protein
MWTLGSIKGRLLLARVWEKKQHGLRFQMGEMKDTTTSWRSISAAGVRSRIY